MKAQTLEVKIKMKGVWRVMLWAWLAHPIPSDFCHTVAETATGRTTTLSAAFLRAASRGECSSTWHTLLAALSRGSDAEVAEAAENILAHGATSGTDVLAGFLWAGLRCKATLGTS